MRNIPIGDFEFGIAVFWIGVLGFWIGDWGKINMGKTLIPYSKSPIGDFNF